jgi:NADH-quinone oxidoreductase subunit H
MAEIKRVPFDLPEGESELIAGYFTEYSSMKFTMFMFGEFVEMILLSAIITTLFLGGWQIPGLTAGGWHWWLINIDWEASNIAAVIVALLQAGKFTVFLLAVLYSIFIARWTFPRFRYDQVMHMGWKIVLPLAILNIMVTGVVLAVVRGWV